MNDKYSSPWDIFYVNAPKNLPDVLKTQHSRLRDIAPALEDPLNLEDFLDELSKAINEHRLTPSDLADVKQDELLSTDINFRQLCQFQAACIAFLCAENQFTLGHEQTAWPLACHTNYLIGITEDSLFLAVKNKELRRKTETAKAGRQKGGAATKAKYDEVRKIMIMLLETHAPQGGWLTKKQAIDSIYNDLVISAKHLNLSLSGIDETALKWLQEPGIEEIKLAYEKNKAKQ